MRHEDFRKYIMSVVIRSYTPRAAASIYSVLNRKILDVATKMESLQEQQDTPLVESDHKQHMFR